MEIIFADRWLFDGLKERDRHEVLENRSVHVQLIDMGKVYESTLITWFIVQKKRKSIYFHIFKKDENTFSHVTLVWFHKELWYFFW